QGKVLGALWPQILDRSRQEAIAPQRAGDCARQQARPDRLGGSQQGTRLRVRQDGGDRVPTCLILAPCSGPSRRGLAAPEQDVRTARRPALTALARGASARAGRDEGTTASHSGMPRWNAFTARRATSALPLTRRVPRLWLRRSRAWRASMRPTCSADRTDCVILN